MIWRLLICTLLLVFPVLSLAGAVLVDILSVDSTQAAPTYTSATISGGNHYRLEASGTYAYGGSFPNTTALADAGYLTSDNWTTLRTDVGIAATTLPDSNFADGPGVGAGSLLADLGTGPEVIYWGDYDPSHIYQYDFIATSNILGFVIGDWWGDWNGGECEFQGCLFDNSGSLTVRIFEVSQVPTPTSLGLLALGLAGIRYFRRG